VKNFKNLKVVILAGGLGTRLGNLTKKIPKPMVEIFGEPLICHIIKIYQKYEFSNFIILTGYKSKVIEKYFKNNKKIKVINTGIKTFTGSRLKKIHKHINDRFFLTYGDGLSSIDIKKLYLNHLKNKKQITMTAVHPPSRFGELHLKGNKLISFDEKPQMARGWINGGFFVVEKEFFNNISKNKNQMLEKEPLQKAFKLNQLNIYKHQNFWKCIDNQRDLTELKSILKKNK
jgi:glucose-1-phosphate cytidylyltransferase